MRLEFQVLEEGKGIDVKRVDVKTSDMASGRGVSALVLGVLLITSPILLNQVPFSFVYPLTAKIAMILNGALIGVSGFLVAGADSYGALLDLYSIIGAILLFLGPIMGYPIGMEFWTTMSFVSGIFLGFPTAMLLHLNRKEA